MPRTHNPLVDADERDAARVLASLEHRTQRALNVRFPFRAHDPQLPPPGGRG